MCGPVERFVCTDNEVLCCSSENQSVFFNQMKKLKHLGPVYLKARQIPMFMADWQSAVEKHQPDIVFF